MGYAITTLPTRYVKKAVTQVQIWFACDQFESNTTETPMFVRTIDTTSLNYLYFYCGNTSGHSYTVYVDIDGVNEDSASIGNGTRGLKKLDLTGVSAGEHLVEVYLKGSYDDDQVLDCILFPAEA